MQVKSVTRNPLSADDTAVCHLAYTKATLHTYVPSHIGWSCHSYTEDVERRVAYQQKLLNIAERRNVLCYLEAEAVLAKLLSHN
jgi:hypothetical protein